VRPVLEDYTYSGLHHSSQCHPASVLQAVLVANFRELRKGGLRNHIFYALGG
jgi:hypothetical protein